ESQWKNSLISLYIIDKDREISLFHQDFMPSQVQGSDIIGVGLAGVAKILKELTASNQELDQIKKGGNLIFLEHGEKIVTAIILKKNLLNTHSFLKEITKHFENNFMEFYDEWQENGMLFKPISVVIKRILKI
ncbi:MAG: hypothetical protein ACXQS8_03040, partial [Candidatus Helarchaeales archaeon]